MGLLTFTGDSFLLDGRPHRVLSGAIHYFRVLPEYWEDSLKKLKACGLNTVETYTCWNLHERKEGEFDFSGRLDVARFVDMAASLGLNVILRPGPYICAEWDFGGLPSWLLRYPGIGLRCSNEIYISRVQRYYQELFRLLRSRLSTQGGPIYMVQIENEYGSFSHDKEYMHSVIDIYRECGVDCLLFTSDGGNDNMLTGGTLDGHLATVNFFEDVKGNFDSIRKRGRTHPLMSGEFWCGQFDHWYEPRNIVSAARAAEQLDEILSCGASVNLYMFQGGTNFGFTNGANYMDHYQPDVTSYDYNAPLSEAGDRTDKYYAIKAVIEKHCGSAPAVDVKDSRKMAYGRIDMIESASLFKHLDTLSAPIQSVKPLTMEDVGQDFGFILYSTQIDGPTDESCVRIHGLHDRALLFVDGKLRGIKERDRRDDEVLIKVGPGETCRLDILVENMGRINFGSMMPYEKKGITRHVELEYKGSIQIRYGWTVHPLPLEDLSGLAFQSMNASEGPMFYRGWLHADVIGDTYLKLPGFTKGVAYINGFNLGRYWNSVGPQQTLYLPGALLCKGNNELIIFELEKAEGLYAQCLDTPELSTLVTSENNLE